MSGLTPETWREWAGALTAVGGVALAAWTRGGRIYGWCRDRWTAWRHAAALRAAEQAEAEKTTRILNETIAILELNLAAWKERHADLSADLARSEQEQERLRQRVEHLETLLDGSRR